MRMRDIITIVENTTASTRPSQQLIEAVKQWVTDTNVDRDKKSQALLACAEEAKCFVALTYGSLYRGQTLTKAEWEKLQETGKLYIRNPTLTSWTSSKRLADDFAQDFNMPDGSASVLIGLSGKRLNPFLDLRLFAEQFSRAEAKELYDRDEYWLHDMLREREVLIQQTSPLAITRNDVKAVYGLDIE